MRTSFPIYAVAILMTMLNLSQAQWSNDPEINLPVSIATGSQTIPKVAVTSDGGCYITWFDNRSGTYAVYVQKLNQSGAKLFGENGLVVSNHPQNPLLVGYDMIADDSSNCIITFVDVRNGGQRNPFIYKISPTGAFLWGANGITLNSQTTVFQANPKLAKCTDNSIFVTWVYTSTPRVAKIQRITPGGLKQFIADGISIAGADSVAIDNPSVVSSDNGSVIMLFAGYKGNFTTPVNYKLYTQKISPTGTSVWNAGFDTVYSLGNVSGFSVPLIYSDGNNGALYSWNDDRYGNSQSITYVQRVNSNGVKLFPINGSAGDTTSGKIRNSQKACIMTSTNETYMFWSEASSTQSLSGLYGQRFSPAGQRLWGDSGKEIIPLTAASFSTLSTVAADSSVYLFINKSRAATDHSTIVAQKYSRSGAEQWMTPFLNVATADNSKIGIEGKVNYNNMSILTWENGNVFAQNINNNGTLGISVNINTISSEIPGSFELKQNYPNPFNPVTKINFSLKTGSEVTLKVFNALGKEVAVLSEGFQNAGTYSVQFDASALTSGVYYYTIHAGDFRDTRKMMLLK